MEQVRSLPLPAGDGASWASEEMSDERAAFHRMLLQNATAAVKPVADSFPKRVSVQTDAYSHGLELIYALQDVDPASIRRIEPVAEPEQKRALIPPHRYPLQLTLDFGHPFREWVIPLVLEEPITVLNLSSQAEQRLSSAGLTTIRMLTCSDLSRLGLGQGHIHEVRTKLTNYLDGRDLQHEERFDVGSLIRAWLGRGDTLEGYALLHCYGLEGLFPLSAHMSAEWRRATPERISSWTERGRQAYGSGVLQQFLHDRLDEVMAALVIPWLKRRGGLASQSEIQERLCRIAPDPAVVCPVLALAADFGCGLSDLIPHSAPGLYCADGHTMQLTKLLTRMTRGYFYRPSVCYPMEQLMQFVMRDLARRWVDCSAHLLERYLMRSSLYRVRRDVTGDLVVRLA